MIGSSELCDLLVQEYEVERAQCTADIRAFLHKLAAGNLGHIVDALAT